MEKIEEKARKYALDKIGVAVEVDWTEDKIIWHNRIVETYTQIYLEAYTTRNDEVVKMIEDVIKDCEQKNLVTYLLTTLLQTIKK